MPITLSPISNTAIKLRWKEPYASEALNRKFAGVIPHGVYRGLRLELSGSDLSVDVAEDGDKGDHLAVVETTDGISTTLRDASSGRITLDLSSYGASTVVIITVFVDYQLGADTSAEFRGYTQAEWDALTASEQGDLLVLGTVLVTAGGIIPAANITHDGRNIPFFNRSSESVPWNPLVKNSGFELGDTGGTYVHASPFWETSISNPDYTIGPVDTDSNAGDKCLEVEAVSGSGVVLATVTQNLYFPVTPGRQVRVRLYKRAVQAATTTPFGRITLSFEDKDGASDTDVNLDFDIDSIDAEFVMFDGNVTVPSGMAVMKYVAVTVSGTYASLGPCIRIDDVQAWYEVDADDWLAISSSVSKEVNTDALFVGNRALGSDGAKVSYDGTDLVLSPRDPSSAQPGLVAPGVILGSSLLSTDAQANSARVTAAASLATGVEYTLMWESVPSGAPGYRKYVKPDGTFAETYNCSWNNTSDTWTRDAGSTAATKVELGIAGKKFFTRPGTLSDTWDDSETSSGWRTTNTSVGGDGVIVSARNGLGNRFVLDSLGTPIQVYAFARQDFWNSNWPTTSDYLSNTFVNGAGSSVILDQGALRCRAGAGSSFRSSAYDDATTDATTAFQVTRRPGFSCKWKIDGNSNRFDWWGWDDVGSGPDNNSPLAMVVHEPAANPNLTIRYEDGTNAEFDDDTGFTPAVDTWYYMTFVVLSQSPGEYLFRIGTTPEWKESDTIIHQTTLQGNGDFHGADSWTWRWNFGTKATEAVTKDCWLAWLEIFATTEWDPTVPT